MTTRKMTGSALNPCPMCGSSSSVLCSGTIEYGGWDWQTLSIDCDDTVRDSCDMTLSLTADFSRVDYSVAEYALISAWNTITTALRSGKGE